MNDCITPDWPAPPNVRAFTSTRLGPGVSAPPFQHFNLGSRCGDDPDAVACNRAALRSHYALPSEPRWLHQVHGTDVVRFGPPLDPLPEGEGSARVVRGGEGQHEPLADAAVTSIRGDVLAVLTADCLPVLLCDDAGTEIAAAHAGWRGLAAGILENTVAAMNSGPNTLMAWLGPAAGPRAYEVGDEVRRAFLDADPAAASAFVATRPGHHFVDLYAIARQRLHALGLAAVYGGNHCTISEATRFYSHRREQRTGRMATLIWIS